jgi:uncharacterized protein (DUF433 family)
MGSPETNSPISDRDLIGAGYEKVREAWLPPNALPQRSAAAARKARQRKKKQGIKQINVEIPADPHARETFRNLARALRGGDISCAAIESLLAMKTKPEVDAGSVTRLIEEATTLTVAQAAYVAGVTIRAANCAIDENRLPSDLYRSSRAGRTFTPAACPLLEFYVKSRSYLAAPARINIISHSWQLISESRAARQGREDRSLDNGLVISFDGLTIDLRQFWSRALARLAKLKASLEVVATGPRRVGPGSYPKVRGTDLSPYDLVAEIAHGSTREEILTRHPELSSEILELALVWGQAHARRR